MQANGIIKRIEAWEINKYTTLEPTVLVGVIVTLDVDRQVRNASGESITKEVQVSIPFVFPEGANYEVGQELVIEAYPAPPSDPDEDRDYISTMDADWEVDEDESSDTEASGRTSW